jgi:hypothetical protein
MGDVTGVLEEGAGGGQQIVRPLVKRTRIVFKAEPALHAGLTYTERRFHQNRRLPCSLLTDSLCLLN